MTQLRVAIDEYTDETFIYAWKIRTCRGSVRAATRCDR